MTRALGECTDAGGTRQPRFTGAGGRDRRHSGERSPEPRLWLRPSSPRLPRLGVKHCQNHLVCAASKANPAAGAKQPAADTVQALTTWRRDGIDGCCQRRRVDRQRPAVADAATGLADERFVVGQIRSCPQLRPDRHAGFMVVVCQRFCSRNGEERSVTRTVDVRLALGRVWTVTGVASIGGSPPNPPASPPDAASEVLADTASFRLGRWDIQRGGTDDRRAGRSPRHGR